MPTSTGGTTAPTPDPIIVFLDHLRALDLTLYVHPEQEEPYMAVPGDTVRRNYPIGSKRVARWLWSVFMDLHGRPASEAAIRAGVAALENRAYEKGVSLPSEERAERFNDDPVLAAIHSWVSPGKGAWVQELATKSFEYLWYYGKNHPNGKKDWPKDTAALGRRIRALDKIGMLAAIKVKFESVHTEAGTVYKFTRTEDADRLTAVRIVNTGGKTMAVKDLTTDSIDLFEELEKLPPIKPAVSTNPQPATEGKAAEPVTKLEPESPLPDQQVVAPQPKETVAKPSKQAGDMSVAHTDSVEASERKAEEVEAPPL